ncbi:uncharacterized protein FOMMEDRAFT_20495 [Fomitiporia mediterranea MF3/22]|uniref:uncharacterized protein n=1 Tax=Fomitiporia mediterranea (strain MF3/22) TaxID=694068 RepID=UPI0004408074|nr:uncharacterized protein FOMMEDRAFT_20495 [Fomitiporia mediterranea MF3/22]EJD03392.1 hypothetical protein FOMMEDRAFT_20495 [Fomitiporia mediterranea MF3/22]
MRPRVDHAIPYVRQFQLAITFDICSAQAASCKCKFMFKACLPSKASVIRIE